jgi:hypothetical protein
MNRHERRSSPKPGEERHRGGAEIPDGQGRILLVDDDVAVLEVLIEGIRGHGVSSMSLPGGLRHFVRPVMIVIRIIGCVWIAAAMSCQPSRDEPEDRERAAALGVPLFRKPFSLAALQSAIEDALASRD